MMKYYARGLEFDNPRIRSVQFTPVLSRPGFHLEPNGHLKVQYKAGDTNKSIASYGTNNGIPSGVVASDKVKTIFPSGILPLVPKILYLGKHKVEVYCMDSHAITYLVLKGKSTVSAKSQNFIKQSLESTTIAVTDTVVKDAKKLKQFLGQLEFIRFVSLPVNDMSSYLNVITTNLKTELDDFLSNSASSNGLGFDPGQFESGNGDQGKDNTVISTLTRPLDNTDIYDYRIHIEMVLAQFYKSLHAHLDKRMSIFVDGKPLPGCDSSLTKDRVDIKLNNLGNLERRPRIYEKMVMDSSMDMLINFQFGDMSTYQHYRRMFQNVEKISNFTMFKTNDIYGLPWNSSIWWEPYKDSQNTIMTKEDGVPGYTLSLMCKLYYYEVRNEVIKTFTSIKVIFPQFNEYFIILKENG